MAEISQSADFEEHVKTYRAFMSMVKWSVISLAVVLVALYFIVNP